MGHDHFLAVKFDQKANRPCRSHQIQHLKLTPPGHRNVETKVEEPSASCGWMISKARLILNGSEQIQVLMSRATPHDSSMLEMT
jgi:hypothetical protein